MFPTIVVGLAVSVAIAGEAANIPAPAPTANHGVPGARRMPLFSHRLENQSDASTKPFHLHDKQPIFADPVHSGEILTQLDDPIWVIRPVPDSNPLVPRCPYHHPAVTALIDYYKSHPNDSERIHGLLLGALPERGLIPSRRHRNRRLSAALTLAHLGDPHGATELSSTFVEQSARIEARTAAIYALADTPKLLDADNLRKFLEHWMQTSPVPQDEVQPTRMSENHELIAGTLWAYVRTRSLQAEYDPARDRVIAYACRCESERVRRVAAAAFASRPWPRLPNELDSLRRDSDPLVRRTALSALATHPTSAGRSVLIAASQDTDLPTRLLAIDLLGKFPGRETEARLTRLTHSTSAAERAHAVRAAGTLGAQNIVIDAARDESYLVRKSAALALGRFRNSDAQLVLYRLLDDRSSDVQIAAVEAWSQQPTQDAVPALLNALASPALSTRRAAVGRLAKLWPDAKHFPITADVPSRERSLVQLRSKWQSLRHQAEISTIAAEFPRSIQHLSKELEGQDLETRQRAIRHLERLTRVSFRQGNSGPISLDEQIHRWKQFLKTRSSQLAN
jgi:HEAT repeat protein